MTDKPQTTVLDPILSQLLLLSVEWNEATLSEMEVARKAFAITRLFGQHGMSIIAMARAGQRAVDAAPKIGAWLSAALEDPNVCDEMKADIRSWVEAVQ